MKSNGIIIVLFLLAFTVDAAAQLPAKIKEYRAALFDPQAKKVLVCAHRGDWRNAPENSVQALKNCIEMNIGIMELDLKRSKDGHLIVMHDNTLDRTVKAKGKPEDYTLAELKGFRLRNGTGHATTQRIPTFEEMMLLAKGKILINVDKGYEYFDEVIDVLRKTGTMGQAVLSIKKNLPLDSIIASGKTIPRELIIMPVLDIAKSEAAVVLKSYENTPNVIVQLDFDKEGYPAFATIPELKRRKMGIWFNSIWPELSGNHDDDKAADDHKPDDSWGWLVKKGANVIQTDRPSLLNNYLKN